MAMRGVGDDGEDEEEDDALFGQPKDATENFIITYGCQPSDGVPVKSTLAIQYFSYLKNMATANQLDDGRKFFLLPSTLNFFQNIDGKCEHAIKTAKPIAIEWKDDFNAQADEGHIDYFAHSDDEEPEIDEDEE